MFYEIYKVLEKPKSSSYGNFIQNFILFNVIVNIAVSISTEFFHFGENTLNFFSIIEYVTVGIFCIELFLRYLTVGSDPEYRGIMGRLRFTVTPFIIIDIISLLPYLISGIPIDSLFARMIRFLKFFRVLKLIRLRDSIKHIFSVGFFATSSISIQFIILFICSAFFISIFAFTFDEKLSMLLFFGPSAIAEIGDHYKLIWGIIEAILGLVIGGTLISIITELLTNISHNIRNGFHPYKGKNHIVIVNNNSKLEFILNEINYYYKGIDKAKDVVIFVPFMDDVEAFSHSIKQYSNISVILITGDAFNWNSYEKLNINVADKIVVLRNENVENKYIHEKLTRYILSHKNFTNKLLEFIVESHSEKNDIIHKQIFSQNDNPFTIINNTQVIQSFLNRSIINPNYFKIYSHLLSFKDFEIDILDFSEVFLTAVNFKHVYMSFTGGVVIGIIKDSNIILNPDYNIQVNVNDKLITITENKFAYSVVERPQKKITINHINKPKLKTKRKICVIGDFKDIDTRQLYEFLHEESINNLEHFIKKTQDEYQSLDFWNEIISKEFDMIIFNLDDDFEFALTMYLRSSYKNNLRFLNSIVNIIHDSINSKLLYSDELKNNIILSEKVVGEFITQTMFNNNIIDIFDEITHTHGNELYLLSKDDFKPLFNIGFEEMKLQLLANNMLYIGSMSKDKFIVHNHIINENDQIVVLAKGV